MSYQTSNKSYNTISQESLLNDLEATTALINQKVHKMDEETKRQNMLLHHIDHDFDIAHEGLANETEQIRETKNLKSNKCMLYGIIVVELIVLVILLHIGLS